MQENKDKRSDADELAEETLVFRREPSPPPSAPRPQNVGQVPQNLQHTAELRGGAVIRPLKKPSAQSTSARQNARMSTPQTTGVRPPQQTVPRTAAVNSAAKPAPERNAPPSRQAQSGAGAQQPTHTITPLSRTALQGQTPPKTQNTVCTTPSTRSSSSYTQSTGIKQGPPQTRQPARSGTPAVPPQPKKRTENDDFEIDEVMTHSRQTKAVNPDSAFVDSATSAIMSLIKAVVYIVAIILVSVGIAVFVINTGNDVFKFVVDEKIVTVEIPEYATIDDVTNALYDAGAIKYKWAFKLWSELKDSGAEFIPGTYEVSTALNYDYLRASFKKNTNKYTEVRITIPEGYTVDEIIDLFAEENGIGTREGFVDAIQNYDFDYRFLEGLTVSEDRIYRLEGYLFPDTYYFYKESSEVTILTKLLDNFNNKFVEEYYARCEQLNITVDEAIILASMIEKETRYADELGDVSSVFHNRLNHSSSFPYLNSDATIMYAMQHDLGGRPDGMTSEDTGYETPYNTYTHKGLPPGPIANPGLNSIKYALYPNKTNYYYFVSDSGGRTLFATTEREHWANINTVRGN